MAGEKRKGGRETEPMETEQKLTAQEYEHLLAYYHGLFGPDSVLALPYELLVRDGRGFVERIATFTGRSFPEEFLAHAFERFRRADEARAGHDGGAGLGLAIVSAVAHAHHGKASAANEPGGGAIVTLTFPQEM